VKLLLFMAQKMARRKSAWHALTLRDGEWAFQERSEQRSYKNVLALRI
jgi:hypothetical protein